MVQVLYRTRLLLPIALLAGCSPVGDYPSLAPRAVERGDTSPAPAPVEAPVTTADPVLAARIVQLVSQARNGDAAFARALEPARDGVRRAGPVGSEGWIAAQEAVSRLEAARTSTMSALGDLDALTRERSQSGAAADVAAISAATSEVSALADAQQEKIGELTAALPSG